MRLFRRRNQSIRVDDTFLLLGRFRAHYISHEAAGYPQWVATRSPWPDWGCFTDADLHLQWRRANPVGSLSCESTGADCGEPCLKRREDITAVLNVEYSCELKRSRSPDYLGKGGSGIEPPESGFCDLARYTPYSREALWTLSQNPGTGSPSSLRFYTAMRRGHFQDFRDNRHRHNVLIRGNYKRPLGEYNP